MNIINFQDQTFPVDEDGFLTDASLWRPEWVEMIRQVEDIDELTEDHWEMINILRDYQNEHGHPPRVRDMTEVTGFKLKYIYEMFPSGPGKGACKMAGLSKPDGCA